MDTAGRGTAPVQQHLFGGGEPALAGVAPERADLGGGSWVDVARGWLVGADTLLDVLVDGLPWRQGRRWMYERHVDDPRLHCAASRSAEPPHPVLAEAASWLDRTYGVAFSGPLYNFYRDGRDSVAPHRDRELRYLDDTRIAILTLGATRPFVLRPRDGGTGVDLRPAAGDLLVMGGRSQVDWEHGVPKVAAAGPRVSVSWRWSSRSGPPERGSWREPRRYGPGGAGRGT